MNLSVKKSDIAWELGGGNESPLTSKESMQGRASDRVEVHWPRNLLLNGLFNSVNSKVSKGEEEFV